MCSYHKYEKNAIKWKFNFKIEISGGRHFFIKRSISKKMEIIFLAFYFDKNTFYKLLKYIVNTVFQIFKSSLHYMYESLLQTVSLLQFF